MSMAEDRWRPWRRLGMGLVLLLAIPSVMVARGHALPAPAADPDTAGASRIDESWLEPGDLLFVDIYHGWSQTGYWDHIAIYVAEPYPSVMEATYNAGIARTPLDVFLDRDLPAPVSVRRLEDKPGREQVLEAAVQYALDQEGRAFDYTATATLPLKLNEGNLHCAELAWRAYRAGGVDLDSNGGLLIYPDDIYFAPQMEAP